MKDQFAIILMKKNAENIITDEIATIELGENIKYVNSIFMSEKDGREYVSIQLTTAAGVEDWEYTAIFDYYEDEKLDAFLTNRLGENSKFDIVVCEEEFNPTWEIKFPMIDDIHQLEEFIAELIEVHDIELQDVLISIKDKEDEYL